MSKKKPKVSTFSRTLSLEEAEREKQKPTPLGKGLKHADEEYAKRRRK